MKALAPTRTTLLQHLKQNGPTSAQTLAQRLALTPMAVRQHLYELQGSGFVSFESEPGPLGRPAKLWKLTSAADRFFADRHAELTVGLLEALESSFGKQGIERLLKARAQQQIDHYRKQIPPNASLAARVKALARLRSAEGYMAQAQPGPEGSQLLIENHCPICVAARSCRGLCGSELDVFQAVLGPEARVERTEHIVTGSRRCVYEITGKPS